MNNFIKTFLLLFLIVPTTSFGYEFSAMTLNVDNLFDTLDDIKKDDKAYLPIEFKQSEAHKKSCNRIPCLLYTSPSPRDREKSRMPSSA